MANDEIIKPPISEISQATQGITEQGIIKLLGLDPALKVEFKNEGNRVFLKISSQTNSYPKTEAGLQYVDKLQDEITTKLRLRFPDKSVWTSAGYNDLETERGLMFSITIFDKPSRKPAIENGGSKE